MVVILLLPPSSTNGCDDNNDNSTSARNYNATENIYYPRKSQNATNSSFLSNKNFIRHVTRVNISDIYSQVEIDGDAEPVTKEGEYLTFAIPFLLGERNRIYRLTNTILG